MYTTREFLMGLMSSTDNQTLGVKLLYHIYHICCYYIILYCIRLKLIVLPIRYFWYDINPVPNCLNTILGGSGIWGSPNSN